MDQDTVAQSATRRYRAALISGHLLDYTIERHPGALSRSEYEKAAAWCQGAAEALLVSIDQTWRTE